MRWISYGVRSSKDLVVRHSLWATLVVLDFVVDCPEDILSDSVWFQTSNWTHICVRYCDLISIVRGLSFEEILTNKISFEVLQFINDLYFKWTLIDGLVNGYDSHGKKHSSSSQEPESSHTLYSNSFGDEHPFSLNQKGKENSETIHHCVFFLISSVFIFSWAYLFVKVCYPKDYMISKALNTKLFYCILLYSKFESEI